MTAPDADRMSAWRDEVAVVLGECHGCVVEDENTGRLLTCQGCAGHAQALLPLLARIDREAREKVGFWDRLGVDEGGMPKHLPMGVTAEGEGPTNDGEAHHFACWCGDAECPLTKALTQAEREARAGALREVKNHAIIAKGGDLDGWLLLPPSALDHADSIAPEVSDE